MDSSEPDEERDVKVGAAPLELDEEGWTAWFDRLVRELWLAYRRLTPEERGRIAKSRMEQYHRALPFAKPTQLIVIWVQDAHSGRDYQLVQVEHFPDRPDREVAVYGPFSLDQYADATAPILEDLRWRNQVHHDHPFPKALEDRLVTAHQYIPAYFGGESQTMDLSGALLMEWYASDIAFASFRDILQTDLSELVRTLFTQTLGGGAPTPTNVHGPSYNAIGSFSYRPFWIEQQPGVGYRQRLSGERARASVENVWQLPYGDTNILAWQTGLIAVKGVADAQLHQLSTLLSVLQLLGIPADPVTPHDALRLEIDYDATFGIMSLQSATVSATAGSGSLLPPEPTLQRFGVLRLAALRQAIQIAERLLTDGGDVVDLIHLNAQARVLAEGHQVGSAAFLFAWTILERWIHGQIAAMPISNTRRDKLAIWSVDHLLELLEVTGRISQWDYRRLMQWKDTRNKAMHYGRAVPPHDTVAILDYTQDVLRKILGITSADIICLEPLEH